jgi:hypothetical protein
LNPFADWVRGHRGPGATEPRNRVYQSAVGRSPVC